jgi:hypothetical protein
VCLPAEWFKALLDRGSSAWHWLGSGSSGRSKTGSTLSHRSLCAGAYCTAAAEAELEAELEAKLSLASDVAQKIQPPQANHHRDMIQ